MNYTWSFSALKDYTNCPKQYQEIKVLKNFYKNPTAEMTYGNVVHKACEDYVAKDTPLAKNYHQFKPVLDVLKDIPGIKYPEQRLALDRDHGPCRWTDGWVRGIVDLLIVDGEAAFIVDYKTGGTKYADPKQLKLMALMTFAHYPEVNTIKAGLLFIVHNSFLTEEYKREDIDKLWGAFEGDLQRLSASFESDVWNPNPTPLCGWCPVKSCDFYKERR